MISNSLWSILGLKTVCFAKYEYLQMLTATKNLQVEHKIEKSCLDFCDAAWKLCQKKLVTILPSYKIHPFKFMTHTEQYWPQNKSK